MLRKAVAMSLVACWGGWAAAQPPSAAPKGPDPVKENTVRILRTSNKAQTNRFVCETLKFNNVNPYDVVNFLWAATSREEGGIQSFVSPEGTSGYVVVMCPEYQLDWLRRLAADLDRPKINSGPGSAYTYYRMRHRNVSDAAFLNTLYFYAGSTGVLWPDVETNSLLIYDAPEGAKAVESVLTEELDKPVTQIEIAVTVYDVNLNSDGTLGLDYESWKNGPGRVLGQVKATGYRLRHSDQDGGARSGNSSASGVYLSYPSAFFDFLVQKGKARSLIQTRLIATNRVPAVLTTGERILYYSEREDGTAAGREVKGETQAVQTSAETFPTNGRALTGGDPRAPFTDPAHPLIQYPIANRPIASAIQAADTGVSLAMIPVVGEEVINLDFELSVVNNLGYDASGQPLLGSRKVTDSIAIPNGQQAMVGGLAREMRVKATRKMPFLGSIPVLGYVFGGETTQTRRSVVVIAVTPRVITGQSNVAEADTALVARAAGQAKIELP